MVKYLRDGEDFSAHHFAVSRSSGPTKLAQGGQVRRGPGIPMDADTPIPPSKLGTPPTKPARRQAPPSRAPAPKQTKTSARTDPLDDGTDYYPPGEAKGGFIKAAVHRPGRLKAMAKREGISTLQAAEKASHSPDPSLRAAGNLGKRFISGDFSHKKKG